MNNIQLVKKYFSSLESKIGYNLLLGGSKHFGYYPTNQKNISEKKAQILYQDLIGQKLNLKENQLVLDAGCGQGVVSTYLAQKYKVRIKGITIIPFEVKRATALAKKLNLLDKVHYQLMDYNTLSFPDNHFDALYTTEALVHSYDVNKTLKEFFRVLKPGGRIVLSEYTIATDKKFSKKEKKDLELVIKISTMAGLKKFRHNRFSETIKQVGFAEVIEEDITRNVKPSFYRLHHYAKKAYKFIKFFSLEKRFTNAISAIKMYNIINKDLFRFCVFSAKKLIK